MTAAHNLAAVIVYNFVSFGRNEWTTHQSASQPASLAQGSLRVEQNRVQIPL